MKETVVTKSGQETKRFAAKFSGQVAKLKAKKEAIVIGLIGELGSGKTTFVQGFARGLGIKKNITSPTFVILKCFKFPRPRQAASSGKANGQVSSFKNLIHIDAYRVEKPRELIDLGFKELIRHHKNVVLIEWADRVKAVLPENCVKIYFEHAGGNKRKITIKSE